MQHRAHSTLVLGLLGLTAAMLLVCSGNTDAPTEPNNPGGTTTITVTPAVSQAPSLAYIRLTGLPAGNNSLYGIVTPAVGPVPVAAVAGDTGYASVIRADSGDFLITPIHPTDPTGGGVVDVVITDVATVISDPFRLTLDTLPEAPGEFAAIVSQHQRILGEFMRINGTSRATLGTLAPADVPLVHVPLALAYNAMDNPANLNNLREVVDGNAPILVGENVDWDMVDRAMATTGMLAYLTGLADSLETLDSLPLPVLSRRTIADHVSASAKGQSCLSPPDYGITDCASLADHMNRQADLVASSQSAGQSAAEGAFNVLTNALGLVPALKIPMGAASVAAWLDEVIMDGHQDLLPSEFVDGATWYDPSVTEFEEDFVTPGTWTQFLVTATSTGWQVAVPTLAGILNGTEGDDGYVPPGASDGVDQSITDMAMGSANEALWSQMDQDIQFIDFCPNSWSLIDCVDPDYSDAVVSSGSLDVNETSGEYKPTDVGSSTLRMETSSAFETANTGFAVDINTNELRVILTPSSAAADTTEEVTFNVVVENAIDKRVNYTLEGGGTLLGPTPDQVTVETPNTEWNTPIKLVAFSLAETGLRATSSDAREDSAQIRFKEGDAFLSPGFICLKPNQPKTFTVTYTGESIDSVRWELDPPGAGTLNGNGRTASYTAPGTATSGITILATVNGRSIAEATVNVSACVCSWVFNASGSGFSYSESGEWADALGLGALVITMKEQKDSTLPIFGFVMYDFTGPGIYTSSDGIAFTGRDFETWGASDPNAPLPTIEITGYGDGDFVEGTVHGQLSQRTNLNPPEYQYITFSATFRAEFFDLDRLQCVDD